MFLSIGTIELLMVVALSVTVAIIWAFSRQQSGWLLGVPLCLAIAAMVTPADPASMLIVAVPYTLGYLLLVRSQRVRAHQRA